MVDILLLFPSTLSSFFSSKLPSRMVDHPIIGFHSSVRKEFMILQHEISY